MPVQNQYFLLFGGGSALCLVQDKCLLYHVFILLLGFCILLIVSVETKQIAYCALLLF